MDPKKMEIFTPSFSRRVEAMAFKLKVEQARPFAFSEQAAKALSEAREAPSLSNLAMACRLAAAELDGSAQLRELAKTLSLAFALPVENGAGEMGVAYPIFGAGLSRESGAPRLVDVSEWDHRPGRNLGDLRGLRASAEAPPLARLALDHLNGLRSQAEGGWVSVDAERLAKEMDRGAWSESRIDPKFSGGRGSYWRGNSERDSEPLRRALSAQQEMLSRLLGEEPGPDSLVGRVVGALRQEGRSSGEEPREQTGAIPRARQLVESALARVSGDELGAWARRAQEGALCWERTGETPESILSEEEASEARALGNSAMERIARRAAALAQNRALADSEELIKESSEGLKEDVQWVFISELLAPLEDGAEPHKAMRSIEMAAMAAGYLARSSRQLSGAGVSWVGGMFAGAEGIVSCLSLLDRERLRARKARRDEERAFDLSGLGDLMELADRCLFAAADLAKEREIAALEAMGLSGAVKALRATEAEKAKAPTIKELGEAQAEHDIEQENDPLRKMLHSHSRASRGIEAVSLAGLMSAVGSKEELERFCASSPGRAYIKFLEKTRETENGWSAESDVLAFLSCLQEFKDPRDPADSLVGEAWADKALAAILRVGTSWGLSKEEEGRRKFAGSLAELIRVGSWGGSLSGDVICEALGQKEGLEFMTARAEQIVLQAPAAARYLVDKALGKPARDPEPRLPRVAPLKRDKELFASLPYGMAGEDRLRDMCSGGALLDEGRMRDAEVDEILKREGFAGEMALGAQAFYERVETREGADARSRANAWLAAGKRLCKEELGLSEAGYKLARQHPASGKRVAGMLEPLLRSRLAAKKAMSASLSDGSEKKSVESRRALRLSRLLSRAAKTGEGAAAAFVVSEAITPGAAESGDLDMSAVYFQLALGPMREGASLGEALGALKRESAARKALEERFDAALMERAGELLSQPAEPARAGKKSGKEQTAEEIQARLEKAAAKALKAELELIADWARDEAGSFFTRLDPKLCWAHLRRGQERWHEEMIKREAADGLGWKAALGSWSDEEGVWSAQELVTPRELSDEGKAMRHCVGGYSSQCSDGASRIFSVKKNGIRALTAQFELSSGSGSGGELPLIEGRWRLEQNKGPCNAAPTGEGAAAVEKLGKALQAGWDAKVKAGREEVLAKAKEEASSDVPGFDPEAALDLAKWKSSRPAAGASLGRVKKNGA